MKNRTFAVLCPLALAALPACEAEHTVDAANYRVSFLLQDHLGFQGRGADEPTMSLEVRVIGRLDAKLESLVVTCDGVSGEGRVSEAPYPANASAAESLFGLELPRRAAGESYTCVLTWDGGARTFRLPYFDPPELNAPAAGATLRVSEPIDFGWPAPAPALVAGARSTISVSVSGACVTSVGNTNWPDEDDDGAFRMPADLVKIDPASCPGETQISRLWTMTPPSEGDFDAELGFEDVHYGAESWRGYGVTLVP